MRITLAHQSVIAFAMLFAALFLPSLTQTANAEIKGPCSAFVETRGSENSANVNAIGSPNSAYKASSDDTLSVRMTVDDQFQPSFNYHRFQLEYAGFRWTIAEKFDSGDQKSWTETFNVNKYATYGKGLYKVVGYGSLTDGRDCIGIAYVDVTGNRLSSVAGAAAAAATAAATVAVVASGVSAAGGKDPLDPDKIGDKLESMAGGQSEIDAEREEQRRAAQEAAQLRSELEAVDKGLASGNPFCVLFLLPALLLTGMAMAGGGQPIAPALPRRRRMTWRPRLSAFGMFGGLIGGAGVIVLLQQFSVLYPTLAVAIIGLVGGLVVGILIPSLGALVRVRRVNRKVARLEARLKEIAS
jgi:hypothetical protein